MESPVCQERADVTAVCGNQRRRYVINPSFQWKFILSISLVVFLVTSIISSVLYGILHEQARARFMNPAEYVAQVPLVVISFALIFSLLASAGVGVWCMFATHRICGPLHVISSHLKELASGRLPKPRSLRARDEFKDFYQLFTQAMESVRKRQQHALRILSDLSTAAETALDAGDEHRKATLKDLARQLQELHDSIVETGCTE